MFAYRVQACLCLISSNRGRDREIERDGQTGTDREFPGENTKLMDIYVIAYR